LIKQATNTTAHNLVCSQTIICLSRQNLQVNVTSSSFLSGLVHSGLILLCMKAL